MKIARIVPQAAVLCWCAAVGMTAAPVAQATDGARLTAFVSADAMAVDGVASDSESNSLLVTTDLLGSWQRGKFRSLAEFVASTEEAELERLQVGWEVSPNTIVWAGRFHQPASYWGYSYHHGQFAQAPITRPQVDQWEDSQGLVPQHLEGVLMDASMTTPRHRIDVSLGAGLAPFLADGTLKPYRVVGHNQTGHQPAYAARLTWFPDPLRDQSAGMLILYSHLPEKRTAAGVLRANGTVDQDVVGAFADFPSDRWRLTAVLYRIHYDHHDTPPPANTASNSFWSGYLQGEHDVLRDAATYGRVEFNSDPQAAIYAGRADPIAKSRIVAGFRWNLVRKQALSVEASHSRYRGATGTEFRLQWSAVVP